MRAALCSWKELVRAIVELQKGWRRCKNLVGDAETRVRECNVLDASLYTQNLSQGFAPIWPAVR